MSNVVGHGVRKRTYAARGLPPRFIGYVEYPRREDGSRNRRSKSWPTRAQAQEWVRIVLAEAANSPGTAGQRLDRRTVAGLLEDWYEHGVHVAGWSPRHAANSRRIIDRCLDRLARFPVHRLTVDHVDDLFTTLAREGVSPHSVRQARNTLRSAFTFAQQRRQIPQGHNPAALARVPQVQRKPPGFVHPDDIGRFIEAVEADWRAPYYLTCMMLALRPSEGAGLTWGDVDLDSGRVHVRRTLHRVPGQGVVLRATKTHQDRTVIMPASLVARLRAHRDALAAESETFVAPARPAFPGSSRADALDVHRASVVLGRLLSDAGLPHVTLYQLRHTGATLRVFGGVPLETVRADLGHATSAMTQQYVQVVDAMRRDSADVVEALLNAARTASNQGQGGTTGGTSPAVTPITRRTG